MTAESPAAPRPVDAHAVPLTTRWRTTATSRIVLAVVHNVTAATRLLDVLPLVASDPRVQVVFTCTGSSAFTVGTVEYLAQRGVQVVPWAEAVGGEFHLAIAASYGGDLHNIKAPLIVVPHGMGYNKYLETGDRRPVFGLSTPWLVHEGRVVPSVIVLSHAEQVDRLRLACPEAVGAALVAGDPCVDRLVASGPLRESYRQALGVGPRQRLILVSSTWGSNSLYGSDPRLIRRLAARLPVDGHRVAVALHPNILHGHSRWQVRLWLDDCARDGVLVLPEEDLWRPTLVSADLVIGDHGSVTFYAAALGTPILLAAAPTDAVDPRSPAGKLLRAAPRLTRDEDPLARIEDTIAGHDPAAYASITELTTSHPGEAAVRLRDAMYALLDLRPPAGSPAVTVLPLPDCRFPHPRAVLATVEFHGEADGELDATVTRYTAGSLAEPAGMPAGAHLVVDVDRAVAGLLTLADVVLHAEPADARRWITETLRALPGCLLAAARDGDGWLVGVADGALVRIVTTAPDAPVFVSLLHAWLCAGRPVERLPGRLTARLAGSVGVATAALVR